MVHTADKTHALLHHMYEHNESHTEELVEIRDALLKEGEELVAEKVTEAINLYDKGNAILAGALSLLGDHEE